MSTELLYLRDAYLRTFSASVTATREGAVMLDRTAFYPTGGGQPHDTGTLGARPVIAVAREGDEVWHTLDGALPAVGDSVEGEIDWPRRHALMRTHTALHVLCGVIWNEWGVPGDQAHLGADEVGVGQRASTWQELHLDDAIGRIAVRKTESKGKGNKRVRLEVIDA